MTHPFGLEDLLQPRPWVAIVAVTERCTLRCVYCPVSLPLYEGRDLVLGDVHAFIQELQSLRIRKVNLNGHGETTMVPGWEGLARRFLEAGFKLKMTSNLARLLSDEEVDVFSDFEQLEISIDTVDREITRQVRRHSDIRTIFFNILRIRARAALKGIKGPELRWICVLTSLVAHGLRQWASAGLALGVVRFQIKNVIVRDALAKEAGFTHPAHMPPDKVAALLADLDFIRTLIEGHGARLDVEGDLAAALQSALHSSAQRAEHGFHVENVGRVHNFALIPQDGETRECVFPWTWINIDAQGDIHACCMSGHVIGNVHEGGAREAIYGPKAQAIRRGLLTGEGMSDVCKTCPVSPIVTQEQLQAKIRKLPT